MSRECACCKQNIAGSICPNCGYRNIVFLDESGAEEEKKRLEEFRRDLAKKFIGFSTMAYKYQWNEDTSSLEEKGKETILIADGEECFGKIAWSQRSFGQNQEETPSERELKLYYQVNGIPKEVKALVKTIACNDFWRLGIQIHEDFTCSVYLGTEEHYTIAGPYALELK